MSSKEFLDCPKEFVVLEVIMSTVLEIDPAKLREARGLRTRMQIVEAAEHKFAEQQLLAWEKGAYRPSPKNLSALLAALNVKFEQVARPLAE